MNDAALQRSYWLCQREARRSGSNFYYSFFFLPREKRRAMAALYAFLRRTDDLGDNDQSVERRREELHSWRQQLSDALAGSTEESLLIALADSVRKFSIPTEYLYAAIDGVEMDLASRRYQTFAELEDYCYHVASVVGLACLYIWGFSDRAALLPARQCGIAFQLTNILRDLWPDAKAGRLYLPAEDLRRFGCATAGWPESSTPAQVRELLKFEIQRAEEFYRDAAELPQYLHPDGRRMFAAMHETYHGLLDRVRKRDVELTAPVRLSRLQKLWFLSRSWVVGPPRPKAVRKFTGATQG
jgi:15-cis-phytoene synthase